MDPRDFGVIPEELGRKLATRMIGVRGMRFPSILARGMVDDAFRESVAPEYKLSRGELAYLVAVAGEKLLQDGVAL